MFSVRFPRHGEHDAQDGNCATSGTQCAKTSRIVFSEAYCVPRLLGSRQKQSRRQTCEAVTHAVVVSDEYKQSRLVLNIPGISRTGEIIFLDCVVLLDRFRRFLLFHTVPYQESSAVLLGPRPCIQ